MKRNTPNFGALQAALTRQRLPDYLPIADSWVASEIMESFLGYPVTSVKEFAEFWHKAGYDYALLYVRGQPLPDHFHQDKVGHHKYNTNEDKHSQTTFDVPLGIKDEETFEKYPWASPQDVYYSDVDAIREFLPAGMKLVVNQGPLFSGLWRIMGLETFSIACLENPNLIKVISEKFGRLCVNIAENILQREWVGAYWVGDDMAYTTGLMVAPEFLRTYVFPFYKQIGDLCRRYDKPLVFHSDGRIVDVFDDLIDCGIDAVHPNEPTSVDIVKIKAQYGDRLSFFSGMDLDLMARGTPDQVKEASKYLIENLAPGGGYIFGGGNSIPKYIPLENYQALLNAAKEFGGIY